MDNKRMYHLIGKCKRGNEIVAYWLRDMVTGETKRFAKIQVVCLAAKGQVLGLDARLHGAGVELVSDKYSMLIPEYIDENYIVQRKNNMDLEKYWTAEKTDRMKCIGSIYKSLKDNKEKLIQIAKKYEGAYRFYSWVGTDRLDCNYVLYNKEKKLDKIYEIVAMAYDENNYRIKVKSENENLRTFANLILAIDYINKDVELTLKSARM